MQTAKIKDLLENGFDENEMRKLAFERFAPLGNILGRDAVEDRITGFMEAVRHVNRKLKDARDEAEAPAPGRILA